jgi:hypothetical protein
LLGVTAGDGQSLGTFVERARKVDRDPAAENISNSAAVDLHV